jgi:hypothetical protein
MSSARLYGKLLVNNWRDQDWLNLSTDAQWLYGYLLSQPTTDTAGVFPIQISKWAKSSPDMTVDRVKAAARQLANHDFIVVDFGTEEGLLRTYIRDDNACPNVFICALRCARQAQSPKLRAALLKEIRQLGRKFTDSELTLIDELESSIPHLVSGSGFGKTTTSPSPSTATGAFKSHSKGIRKAFGGGHLQPRQ